ncbi:MAG: hypothetical protein QOG15_2615 [Solirubrobacteraceae bacterium]|jgi:hypothetical protein|nr:hypothetical protein [Solirubrobacteraceae bacterium]
MNTEISDQSADTPVPHDTTSGAIVATPERVAQGAAALGFVVGMRRTSAWKGSHMRSRRMNQLAPAMMSLAATNQQLLGLVGSRRSILWRAAPLAVAAAGVAYLTADEDGRAAMQAQAQALAEQAGGLLTSSGVLDKLFK